jgi:glycerol kinase
VENIAFFMKDIADVISGSGVEPRSFSLSGGLSSLSYLVQVQADILGKELRVSSRQEVSALGAALLAGLASGTWTFADIRNLTTSGEAITPRRNSGAEKRYQRWKELHRATAAIDLITPLPTP